MTLFPKWRLRRIEREPLVVAPFDWARTFFSDDQLPTLFEGTRVPRADIAETDKEYLVTLELPGFDPSEVEVHCSESELVVSGERNKRKEDKDKHYHRVETSHGRFERRFELPVGACKDTASVEARFDKGMLEIHVPKAESKPVTRVPIKST